MEPSDKGGSVPPQMKEDIANAVQQAVRVITHSEGFRKCQLEASAGLIVATALTGIPFELVVGRITLLIHKAVNGMCYWTYPMDPYKARTTRLPPLATESWDVEHCWLETEREERTEIVDFSSWQYRDYFSRRYDVHFDWSPPFYWGWEDDIPSEYRRWYSALPLADHTGEMKEELLKRREVLQAIAGHAFNGLHQKGYSRPPEFSLWPAWLTSQQAVCE